MYFNPCFEIIRRDLHQFISLVFSIIRDITENIIIYYKILIVNLIIKFQILYKFENSNIIN